MNDEKKKAIELLAGSQLFCGIPTDDLAPLADKLDLKRESYSRGQLIQERGRPVARLRLVLEGTVSADLIRGELQENENAGLFVPGRTLGLETFFSTKATSPCNLTAAEEGCVLLSFDLNALLADDCPPYMRQQFLTNWLGILSDLTIRNLYWLQVLSQRSLRDKILTFASIMCGKTGSNTFILKMNQSQFAAYLRVARPSLNRELRLLKNEGVLKIKGRKYTVLKQLQWTPSVRLLQAEPEKIIEDTDSSAC